MYSDEPGTYLSIIAIQIIGKDSNGNIIFIAVWYYKSDYRF